LQPVSSPSTTRLQQQNTANNTIEGVDLNLTLRVAAGGAAATEEPTTGGGEGHLLTSQVARRDVQQGNDADEKKTAEGQHESSKAGQHKSHLNRDSNNKSSSNYPRGGDPEESPLSNNKDDHDEGSLEAADPVSSSQGSDDDGLTQNESSKKCAREEGSEHDDAADRDGLRLLTSAEVAASVGEVEEHLQRALRGQEQGGWTVDECRRTLHVLSKKYVYVSCEQKGP